MLKNRYACIKVTIVLRQCRPAILLTLAWFTFGFILFYFHEHLTIGGALVAALYLKAPVSEMWELYSFWGQCVLFGIVVAVFLLQAFQQYNPKEVCFMLAKEMKNHTVVVGYTHLGERIVSHLRHERKPYVLIEKEESKVNDLIRAGEPVLVDNAQELSTLNDANIKEAIQVVVASNNIETSLLVTKRARELNKTCRIITRCYQDDFVEILETLGANEVISSSQSAFREYLAHTGKPSV